MNLLPFYATNRLDVVFSRRASKAGAKLTLVVKKTLRQGWLLSLKFCKHRSPDDSGFLET
jgi:hypothetical protein